jgi:hypothetical protein
VKISQSLPFIIPASLWSGLANQHSSFYHALVGENQPITVPYFTMLLLVKLRHRFITNNGFFSMVQLSYNEVGYLWVVSQTEIEFVYKTQYINRNELLTM